MSDGSLADALVAAYPHVIEEQLTYAAMGALIVYDQLLTFDREVRLVWRRKVTGATVLFLLNRYFLLARFLVIFGAYGISSQEGCVQSVLAGEVLQTAPYLIWAAIVFFTSCMPLATNTYVYTITTTNSFIPPFNCVTSPNISEDLYLALLLLTRSSVIIGDMIVLGVSWYKTYSTWRVAKSAAIKASFAATILRDGTIYFLMFLTINILHLVFSLKGLFTDSIVIFQDPIISILVSRFILNLRDIDTSGGPSTLTQPGGASQWNQSLNFAAFDGVPSVSESELESERPAPARSRIADFVDPLGAPLDGLLGEHDYLAGGDHADIAVVEVAVDDIGQGDVDERSSSEWSRTSMSMCCRNAMFRYFRTQATGLRTGGARQEMKGTRPEYTVPRGAWGTWKCIEFGVVADLRHDYCLYGITRTHCCEDPRLRRCYQLRSNKIRATRRSPGLAILKPGHLHRREFPETPANVRRYVQSADVDVDVLFAVVENQRVCAVARYPLEGYGVASPEQGLPTPRGKIHALFRAGTCA
ncbi:hypothetical protein OH76DRAFT_1420278 [Lentinus brumalis]|uniref:DUF6533 domain-containing protein n=1 Tax=Lentinus brumalis TaxID=2498619 RepID=A0A371D1I3_9APHY|nr:hypothetical protein OH76DRAFT_1420278 [Polyporus brumalis]